MKSETLIVFLIAAVSTAVCFFLVQQASDPTGGDGYFYLKQIEVLAIHGRFYHADYSLIFLPLTLLYLIFKSSLFAYQLVTSLIYFFTVFATGLILIQNCKNTKFVSSQKTVLGIFLLAFSIQPPLLHLSFEFAKNGMALALILFSIYFYLLKRMRISALLLFFAVLTHKLVVVFLGCYLMVIAIQNYEKISKKKILQLVFIVLTMFSVFNWWFPRLKFHFSNFLQNFSIESSFFLFQESQLISRLLLILIFLGIIIGAANWLNNKSTVNRTLVIFCGIPFLPVFGGYNTEIKYRLFIMSLPLVIVLASMSFEKIKTTYSTGILLGFTALLLFSGIPASGFPWIAHWSETIVNTELLEQRVNPTESLVTHHSLQFYIDYKTPIRARSMLSPNEDPIYQIAFTPEFFHLNAKLSDEIRQIQILSLGSSYGLFYYGEFQELMNRFPVLSNWRNQFHIRPDFIESYSK